MTERQRMFAVQVGAFSVRENAEERMAALRRVGFLPHVVFVRGLYKVRVGMYRDRTRAGELVEKLRVRGYDAIIVR